MVYPSLEELLTFEENVFLPRGVEISQLEHFPRNFNPFILKQYLADAHQHPEEYKKLLSFYEEVALPLEEKKHACQKELGEKKKTPLGAAERIESILLWPYTATMSIDDYVNKLTGSPFVGSIVTAVSALAALNGLGYVGIEAQIGYAASLAAGFISEHREINTRLKRAVHFMEQTVNKREKLDFRLKQDFPLLFGRGYEDLDMLGREIYTYFEGKKD